MIKKALYILSLSLALLVPVVSAQQVNGRWTLYPTVGDGFKFVVEGNDRLYAVSGNTLSHYSFDDNEHYIYNKGNGLSENGIISNLYYNSDKGFLLVAYATGNIDLIYDNGHIVNMPEIRDAVLTTTHGINGVTFDGDRIYVATDFGFVIFDEKKHEVVESGIFKEKFNNLYHIGDHLVLHRDSNKRMYIAPDKGSHTPLSSFSEHFEIFDAVSYRLNGNSIAYIVDNSLYQISFNVDDAGIMTPALSYLEASNDLTGYPLPMSEGIFAQSKTKYYFVKPDLTIESIAIPEALKGATVKAVDSPKSLWAEINGVLGRYDVSGDTPRLLMTFEPPKGTTVAEPVHFRWTKNGDKLYIAGNTATFIYNDIGDNMTYPNYMDAYSNGTFTDIAVNNVSRYISGDNAIPDLEYNKATNRLGAGLSFAIDPDDESIYYQANNGIGIAMIKDNSIIAYSNKQNNPTPTHWWLNRTMAVDIDSDGNLWMCIGYVSDDNSIPIAVLPASKRRNLSKITESDWHTYTHAQLFGAGASQKYFARDVRTLFCKKSNMLFIGIGAQEGGIIAINHNGTLTNPKDDKIDRYDTVTDTEGNDIFMIFNYDMVEDQNGAVWMATDRGVFYIPDPTDATNVSTMRVKRPIVPRNDGTNYGDYLLETERVYCIAVDPSNRKWLGTYSSGVYLVSEDGTKILAHYTAENSPLPSNWIYRITCDPNSNKVYFGTSNGLAEFDSDSSPAAEDYSEVYAYPNPVRPEYTGWITIAGLMDNSLVKIADMAGNVFFTARSEGGMVAWDGCDSSGNRVKTGVYLVFASQNATGSNKGAVAKIMVVN